MKIKHLNGFAIISSVVLGAILTLCPFTVEAFTASGVVTQQNGIKTYTYTLRAESEHILYGFSLGMPTGAKETIIAHGGTYWHKNAYHDFDNYTYDSSLSVRLSQFSGTGVIITLWIQTLENVPTAMSSWSYRAYGMDEDGTMGGVTYNGDNLLPVPAPVPEPTSLATLSLAVLGLGRVIAKQRRHLHDRS